MYLVNLATSMHPLTILWMRRNKKRRGRDVSYRIKTAGVLCKVQRSRKIWNCHEWIRNKLVLVVPYPTGCYKIIDNHHVEHISVSVSRSCRHGEQR